MPKSLDIVLADAQHTEQLGRVLAQLPLAPAVIYLSGDLGTGKTTLSRGFIQASGHSGAVKSPTYTLIEPYEMSGGKIYHLDLYRLNDPVELEFLGLEDLLAQGGVCLIEWPERASAYLPPADLTICLYHLEQGRRARLIAHQPRAESWLQSVLAHFPATSHLKD
jgi:tRNA threonylcarbamoyladenosine biosynthesis protein TsaE